MKSDYRKKNSWILPLLIALFSWACSEAPPLGERIRNARLKRALSQKDCAKQLDMQLENLSLIEDGLASPAPEQLRKIEALLDIELLLD